LQNQPDPLGAAAEASWGHVISAGGASVLAALDDDIAAIVDDEEILDLPGTLDGAS